MAHLENLVQEVLFSPVRLWTTSSTGWSPVCTPLRCWYALAAYLQSFGEEGIPGRYSLPGGDGRKDVSRSWNPIELVKNPSWITVVALLVLAVAVIGGAFLLRWLRYARRRRRYGKKKNL